MSAGLVGKMKESIHALKCNVDKGRAVRRDVFIGCGVQGICHG